MGFLRTANHSRAFRHSGALAAGVFVVTAALLTGCGVIVRIGRPTISWSAPSPIVYGTALGPSQLNANADVAGTFQYSPAGGTLPLAGTHTLSVTFTPNDLIHYSRATASVTLNVLKGEPAISWQSPTAIPFGTPLTSAQLNATASVRGVFSYNPSTGTVLDQGMQRLSVKFTPADSANYSVADASVQVEVKAVPIQLSLTSGESSVLAGKSTKLSTIAGYSDGSSMDFTDSASYSVEPAQAVEVTKTGEASCLMRGTAQITARLGSLSAQTTLTCMQLVHQQPFSTLPDEFVGPFANWYDVKSKFGAKGDGITDDTAALQKAFDALSARHSFADTPVLWVPAGKYVVASTLKVASQQSISIVGEDPKTTSIVWNGPASGTMILFSGVARSRIARLTLDGVGALDTGFSDFWDGQSWYYPGLNSITDMIFKRMGHAARVGFAGPLQVERVRFIDITSSAISEEDWNAGEVWIRDSFFQHCRVGITNENGAGQFNVYGSVFLNSTKADMYIKNTQFFSARGNTSIGSQAFFIADPAGANGAQIVLQDNLIADSASTPISIGNRGPLMLIDNTILLPQNSTFPVMVANDFGKLTTDVLTMGNVYTSANLMSGNFGRKMSIDDQVVRREEVSVQMATAAAFLPNFNRKVIEIPASWKYSQIQQSLDDAGAQSGSRTALHFAAGLHYLADTLVISGGSDVQLIGDGMLSTQFVWTGMEDSPMILIKDPARATVRDVDLHGRSTANGIKVQVNDVPGSRVSLSMIDESGDSTGMVSDGLDQAMVEARGTAIFGENGIRVIGGISGQANATTFGGYRSFGGGDSSSGIDGYTYDVRSGGQLTVEDVWHDDGGSSPNFVHLTDSGTVSFECGFYATPGKAAFSIDGFKGDVSLIGYQEQGGGDEHLDGRITVSGDASRLRFLTLGVQGHAASSYFQNSAEGGNIGFLMSSAWDQGLTQLPDQGKTDKDFVRSMFSHVRHMHTVPTLPTRAEQTDVRFDHVRIESTKTGIHLVPAAQPSRAVQFYSIESSTGLALSGSSGQTLSSGSSGSSAWLISHLDDGGYQIAEATTGLILNSALRLDTDAGTPAQSWMMEPIGDGNFSIRNLSTGLWLSLEDASGLSAPMMLPEGTGNQEWKLVPVV